MFSYILKPLQPNKTYYYKAFAINEKGESVGDIKTFTSLDKNAIEGVPVVQTNEALEITTNTALLKGALLNSGNSKIIQLGFYYGESESTLIKKSVNITDSIFTLNVTSLKDETTYYFKAFAINDKGESIGKTKTFITKGVGLPVVLTSDATKIETNSATLNGFIANQEGYGITKCGFYYGESINAMIKKESNITDSIISLDVTNLTDGTTYYYKVFATNQKGETCGDIKEFKTNIAKAPEVQTLGATDINIEAATLHGEIISNGDYEITQRGFYFGESKDVMTKKVVSTTNNTISLNVTSLTDGTTYYYKVFATNQKGESCGDIREFKTINGVLPMIITDNATAVSYEQATLNGSILDYGSFDIIECGFYYGTDENYMTKVVAVKYDDNFNITINNLTDNTTYYYKAYVKTKKGEELGYTVVFSTLDDSIIQPWDGTIASSFAGGSGTFIDPYLINTPSQLAYITKESGAYYKLIKDLDLDNRPWKPITLNGNFDGNGKTISNLYINRNQDRVGLFESASGKICNLTISNVNIKIPTCSEIGALAGYSYGCEFDNCHVILTNSCITGNQDIGGLVGHVRCSAKSNNTFKNCSIISQSDNFVINGNRYVGGICGLFSYDQDKYISAYISNCHVKANILAQSDLGGLFGAVSLKNFNIEKCSYNGNVTGEKYLGGMIGSISYNVYFTSSKTTIKINANGYAGGFVGLSSGDIPNHSKISIVSCYTNIDLTNSTGNSGGFVGYINVDRDAYFSCCYSLITANNSSTNNIQGFVGSRYSDSKSYTIDCATAYSKGIWEGENSILNCKNQELIEHLQYSGSEYLINWNFNNTWTWTGVVDGVSKSVVCPRLSWE